MSVEQCKRPHQMQSSVPSKVHLGVVQQKRGFLSTLQGNWPAFYEVLLLEMHTELCGGAYFCSAYDGCRCQVCELWTMQRVNSLDALSNCFYVKILVITFDWKISLKIGLQILSPIFISQTLRILLLPLHPNPIRPPTFPIFSHHFPVGGYMWTLFRFCSYWFKYSIWME